MSIQGLPCTMLNHNALYELSSQAAETDIEGNSLLSQRDGVDTQNNMMYKNCKIDGTDFKNVLDASTSLCDKKINLYDPAISYVGTENVRSSIGNLKMLETQLKSNIDESMMSVVSSAWDDEKDYGISAIDWEVPSTQILEQLSNSGNKGSHRSEVQLRYFHNFLIY